MLRSLLVAIAAALLVGAAVTNRAEAQGWSCTYDFANGAQGWAAVNGNQGTLSGGAWQTADLQTGSVYRRFLQIYLSFSSTTITSVSISNSFSLGSVLSGYKTLNVSVTSDDVSYTDIVSLGNTTSPSNPHTWTGSQTKSKIYVQLNSSVQSSASYSGSASISSITLSGTGTQPTNCGATPTPVPPTATNTPIPPTATNTPPPSATPINYPTAAPFVGAQGDSYWGNTYNMTYGLQGWSLISGTLGGGRVVSANVSGTQRLEMEYPITGNVRLTDFFANYEASCPHTFEVKDGGTVFESGSVGAGMQALVWQGEHVVSNGSVRLSLVGSPSCGVSAFQLYEITLMGYGANPTNLQATAIAIQAGDLYSGLSGVNALLDSLPDTVNSGVPDETGRTLFGYAKWLISPSSADELAGPFAPIVSHTGIFLTLVFALTLVYAIVWAAVWIFRFVVWLFKIIMLIIQVVVGVIGSILKFIF
jgi:hypothetical protein